ncbi:TPA: response regulator transcription factor [Corynebacterium striatum]|uniref:response regulator transcription factor n=1 Tax=Corynebacterium striatum TaxID=43770 RepID=UPI000666D14B|nr:response regulator transcription factor [Corynebacterium striatum]QRP19369.1 response regulator transcription factor [Corynebacterium striatum]HAT1304034.1 response regulator transcription factor [Corynebacterium striatum]HAT1392724.1 response regulator transcription factor [Corynebacterium striatum]HAT1408992.1 response regulator transcription factor [Corynebacterium striatum]HAT1502873.1 response regulator transcription factor [Corynebacterium striatum]
MKILLAEDSALLRAAIEQLLRSLDHEVTTVEDADQLRAAAEGFDIIVTDVRMPPLLQDDGLRAVNEIRKRTPEQPVVVLSQYVAASYLDGLIEHGGFGYLLKERIADVDEFIHALDTVSAGGTVVDPEVVSTLLSSRKMGVDKLTPREREVLALMAQGASNREIEGKLVLTAGAISKHVANVFMKLGFSPEDENRRVKAVLAWLRTKREWRLE